ncbi:protein YqeH [Porphyridium purpureum]|uniref:Protein YqeH n=1 Tax=Porphyridium purpureum TaxID=35688 RepID=A0A5J4Z977_PORPP|nr:protein YqeH [Porphyridium purpureum]|eukprot:POR0204..scf295_1
MTIDTMDYGNAGYLDEDEEQEPDVEDEDPNLPAVVSGSARDLGLSPFKRSRVARDLYRGILCKRCKLLEKGDYLTVQKTLDKIDPNVFANQLASLKSQRVLIVKVVDALDFEGTFVRELRRLIGGNSVVLAVTKMDLIVAPDDEKGKEDLLKWFEGRLRMKGLRVEGKFAVSGKTGEGVGALAEFCVDRLMGRNLYVVGFANVGKSTLVNALKKEYVEHIFYRGPRGRRRKAKLEDSAVTVAALPGTTLRSIRIPVFRSHKHAMWDTPGLIIRRFLFPGLKPKLEEVARQPPERIRPQSFVLNAGEILVIGDNYAQLEIEPDDPTSTRRNSIEVRWYSLLCDRIQRFASYDEYLAQGGAERYPRSIEVDALSAQEKDEIKRAVYDGETSPPGAVTMLKRVKPARSQLQYPLFDVDVVLLNLGFFAVRAKNNFFKVKVYAPFFFQLIVRPSMPIPFASPVDGMISVRQARRLDQGQDGRSNSAAELLTADWGGISRKGGAGKQRWEESGDQRDAEGDFDDEEEAGGMAPYTLDGDDAGYQAAMLKQSREYSALRTVIRLDSGELVPVTESAWGALEELESEDEGDFATPDELLQRRDALLEEQSDVENNSDDDIESQLSTAASESESEERRREEARRSSLVVGSGQRLGGGLNIAAGSVVPTVDDEIFKEDDADWFSDKGSDDEGASASAAPAVSRAALEEEADLFDWSLAEEVPTSLTSTESDSSAELEVPKAVEEGQGMSEDVGGGSVRGRVEEDVGTVRGAGEGAARTGSVADDEESAEAASEPGTSVPAERSRTPASAGEKAVKQDAAPTDVSSSELEVDASNSQRSVEDNGSRAQTASAPEAESKVSADIGFELPRGRARKTFRSRGDSGRNLDQLAEEFLLARRSGTPGPPQMDNKEGNGGSGSWKDKIAAQNDQRRPTATRAEDSAQTADEDNFEKLFEEGW